MSEDEAEFKVAASEALDFKPVIVQKNKVSQKLTYLLFVILAFGVGASGWAFYGEKIVLLLSNDISEIPLIRSDGGPVKGRPIQPGGIHIPNRDKLVYDIIHGSAGGQSGRTTVEKLLPLPEAPIPKNFDKNKLDQKSAIGSPFHYGQIPEKPKRIDEVPRVSDVSQAEKPMLPPNAPKLVESSLGQPSSSFKEKTIKTLGGGVGKKDPVLFTVSKEPLPKGKVNSYGDKDKDKDKNKKDNTTFLVQVAAARTLEAAKTEWSRIQKKNFDLLEKAKIKITKVNLGSSKGIFFRLRVGPLSGDIEARKLCESLKKRKAGCLVIRLKK